MQLGAVFPQTEIGPDPSGIADFATAIENAGFDLILGYDHVLGVDPADPDFDGPYDNNDPFHEPFTLFGFLAGYTESVTLGTGILILPQRQTALVAKQAAEVDILSDGRLRLGVGVGWNEREYEALGMDFGNRGRRIEEQVEVLRRLWTEDAVSVDGRWHALDGVGINPLPVQQPIPVWMGGEAEPVLRRTGRLADAWLPPGHWKTLDKSLEPMAEKVETIRDHAIEAGRDPDELRIVPRIQPTGDSDAWVERAREWVDLGATHIVMDTVRMELSVEEHVRTAWRFYEAMIDGGINVSA